MNHQLLVRSTCSMAHLRAFRPKGSRKLTTTPPPFHGQSATGQMPPSHPEGSNTLIILSALGALGGLYYYYTRGKPAIDRETARNKEEGAERKVREIGDGAKSKVESVARQGQRDFNQVKQIAQDTAFAARNRATEAGTDLAERARHSARDAQVKLGDLKDTAEQKMSDTRDRLERKIEEGKEDAAYRAREAEKKTRSWFGWGSK